MIEEIMFPSSVHPNIKENSKSLYYNTHFKYVLNCLKQEKTKIIYSDSDNFIKDAEHFNHFKMRINGIQVVIDYSDHLKVLTKTLDSNIPYFKFHTTEQLKNNGIIPFCPISFHDWKSFYTLQPNIIYNSNNISIFYRCRIYGAAIERRTKMRSILRKVVHKNNLILDFIDQNLYWNSFNQCKVNVIVPGAREDIVDRTHLQSFAFGIPVISPNINIVLPYNEKFEPNIDYIKCASNFEDIPNILNTLDCNFLNTISMNCKHKFVNICSPNKLQQWVIQNI